MSVDGLLVTPVVAQDKVLLVQCVQPCSSTRARSRVSLDGVSLNLGHSIGLVSGTPRVIANLGGGAFHLKDRHGLIFGARAGINAVLAGLTA